MLDMFFTHKITLTRYRGRSSLGDVFADPEPLLAFVNTGHRIYLTADGREKVASGTVYLPAGTEPPPLMSEITCRTPGLHGKVGQVTEWDGAELGLPECIEVVID